MKLVLVLQLQVPVSHPLLVSPVRRLSFLEGVVNFVAYLSCLTIRWENERSDNTCTGEDMGR